VAEGMMSPEEAERCIWAFFWQLANSRDRRIAPVRREPPDILELQRQQYERDQCDLDLITKSTEKYFTDTAKLEAAKAALAEVEGQRRADQDQRGRVDHGTGLPLSGNDLAMGRGVVSGTKLALGAGPISPTELAEACSAWLEPCPPGQPQDKWGNDPAHWQVMAFKPKEVHCPECKATGIVTETTKSGLEYTDTCEKCRGDGTICNWTDEELQTVEHNALQIKKAVHRLAEKGWFNLRPINERDEEMADLDWTDEMGFTLGFKITWEGFRHMQEYCSKDPSLQRQISLLLHAGRDVREGAPQWARDEYGAGKG